MTAYVMQTEPFEHDPSIVHTYAATPSGAYIGDEGTAKFLCKERGINPELASPNHKVCSIGFCEKEHKWYGWSHRAIFGFGIGSEVKKGDCGYVPVDMADAIDEAVRFWDDEHHNSTTADAGVDDEGRQCIRVQWMYDDSVPNKSLRGTIGGTLTYPPEQYGRGEWTAKTLDDAKQMAIDFAEGVS